MDDQEANHWVKQMMELWRHYPRMPFQAVPYDAVRGISWRIMDGDARHIAIVFDEDAANLIAQRLNA
jgi:hypothetical protein